MKEPGFLMQDGTEYRYSEAPSMLLRKHIRDIAFQTTKHLEFPECYDIDFRRRYVAILLLERGE